MSYVVFDFEAVRDDAVPYEPRVEAEWVTQGDEGRPRQFRYRLERVPADPFPPVCHFRLVCGGMIYLGRPGARDAVVVKATRLSGTEPEILSEFLRVVKKGRTMVDFGGRGFDAPLAAVRAMRYGIDASVLFSRDFSDRYRGYQHLDLVEAVTNFGATQRPKMAAMARLVGWPGKTGVDGSQVDQMVRDGHLEEVERYCMWDVANEAAILLRLELVRGIFSPDEYASYARALLDLVDADPDFEALRDLIDRELFLYCYEPGRPLPQPKIISSEEEGEEDEDDEEEGEANEQAALDIAPSGSVQADLDLRNRVAELLLEQGVETDGGDFEIPTGKFCIFCVVPPREAELVADAVRRVAATLGISDRCTYRGPGEPAATPLGGAYARVDAAEANGGDVVDEIRARWRAEGLTDQQIDERLDFESARNCYKSDTGINPPNWTIEEARAYLVSRGEPSEKPTSAEPCDDCGGEKSHLIDCGSQREGRGRTILDISAQFDEDDE